MIRGILGGSFDPVHCGHLAMARHILARGHCDILHVVPARLSPHKMQSLATAEQRLEMVKLAFAHEVDIQVDEREIRRPGPSFTAETLAALQEDHPKDSLLLVMGQDSWAALSTWKNPAEILRLARIAVLERQDHEGELSDPDLSDHPVARFFRITDFRHPVSSTRIRAMLGGDPPTRARALELLPVAVSQYVQHHGLYLSGKD